MRLIERGEVTVAICTRNREGAARVPATAVLNGTYANVRVLIIDQSDDDSTCSALGDLLRDPRLEYHRDDAVGVSHARNRALTLSTGPLLLFTDDDCEPAPTWVAEMVHTAGKHEGPFIIFAPLVPQPKVTAAGIIPSWTPAATSVRRAVWSRCLGGVTANACFSREAIDAVGAFHLGLGRGTKLNAGEDYEYAVRLLDRGGFVVEVTGAVVHHRGLVPPERIREWLRGDLMAAGTMLGWQCRARNRYAFPQFLQLVWKEAKPAIIGALTLRRPAGALRAFWLSRGFITGLMTGDQHFPGSEAVTRGACSNAARSDGGAPSPAAGQASRTIEGTGHGC